MIAPKLDTEKISKVIDTENKYSGSIMAALIGTAPKKHHRLVNVYRCSPYRTDFLTIITTQLMFNLTKVGSFCSKQKNQLVLLMINQILYH